MQAGSVRDAIDALIVGASLSWPIHSHENNHVPSQLARFERRSLKRFKWHYAHAKVLGRRNEVVITRMTDAPRPTVRVTICPKCRKP